MKTILFISTYIPNPKLGGVERVTDLLAKELIRRGYRVLYLALRKRKADHHYDAPAPLYHFPSKRASQKINDAFYHDFLLEHQVDIIINQSALHHSRCKLFLGHGLEHVKTISTIHNLPLLEKGMMAGKIAALGVQPVFQRCINAFLYLGLKFLQPYHLWQRKRHYRFLHEKGSAISVLSKEYIRDMCVTCGVPADKVFSISNPLSFKCDDCCLDEKKKQVLFVGRFSSTQKRPEILLEIWRRIYLQFPDWELVMVGDGRGRKNLERMAAAMERVRFVGFQYSEPFYKEASIFCMTSPYEGLPMVLIEAQCYGVVPMAFHSFASVTDIISDGQNGCLIQPFDLDSYAERLSDLMRDDAKRLAMAKNAHQSVMKFDVAPIVDEWEACFDALAEADDCL